MDKAFRKKGLSLAPAPSICLTFFPHTYSTTANHSLWIQAYKFQFFGFQYSCIFFFLLFQYYCTYFNGKLVMSPIQLETQQYFTDCIELFKIQSCKTVYPDNFRSWHIPLMLYRKLPYFHGQELSQFQIWSVPFR